jgi:LacI family transcriptional regulator
VYTRTEKHYIDSPTEAVYDQLPKTISTIASMNMKDLADQLGLSVSTVSKAINGRFDINEQTRERVREAAERANFSPDPAGRRLRLKSSDTIGFVLSAPQAHFAHPFFLDMLSGIEEELADTPFQVIIASARSVERELECFKRLVDKLRVDALVFGRTRRDDPRISYLLKRKIPFVAFGRSETPGLFPSLDIDHTVVGRDGCARFIALGHRRIALANTPGYLMLSHHHKLGYESALRAATIEPQPELYVEGEITEEGGARAAHQLLDLPCPPTAIVCGHDLMAIGVMRAISERGLVPGQDVGVIGGDNHPVGRLISPALTTFSAETHAAGRRMVQMLLSHLNGTPAEQLQEIWAPELIVRSSDGPKRSASAVQYRRQP